MKSLQERVTMQFKNRLVSRCSSNPRTHQEFLFIIGLHLGHKKDKAATRVCMYNAHQGILLQTLMEKPQIWTHNNNNTNRQPWVKYSTFKLSSWCHLDSHQQRFTNSPDTSDVSWELLGLVSKIIVQRILDLLFVSFHISTGWYDFTAHVGNIYTLI